jgi:hypothetical protein
MQRAGLPSPEHTQAVVAHLKQRIRDAFPHGTDSVPVMRCTLDIKAETFNSIIIHGFVDTTPAQIYEEFSDFITIRYVHGTAMFSRRFWPDEPDLDRYVSELIDLLMLQKFCERYLN